MPFYCHSCGKDKSFDNTKDVRFNIVLPSKNPDDKIKGNYVTTVYLCEKCFENIDLQRKHYKWKQEEEDEKERLSRDGGAEKTD